MPEEDFLALPCLRVQRVVVTDLHRLGCKTPETQLILRERPLSTIPTANAPHLPLIHSSKANCREPLAHRRCGALPPTAQGPAAPAMPAPTKPTPTKPPAAYQHGTYGLKEKTIPQLANPKLQGGPSVRPRQAWKRKPLLHRCPIYSLL